MAYTLFIHNAKSSVYSYCLEWNVLRWGRFKRLQLKMLMSQSSHLCHFEDVEPGFGRYRAVNDQLASGKGLGMSRTGHSGE